MKLLDRWPHLEEYGIVFLTGESCGYMFRLLFDVTARGKRIIEKCFDCELVLKESWNGGRRGDPHVGSILLSQAMFAPLATFALLDDGFAEVWTLKTGSVLGFTTEDKPDHIATMRTVHQGNMDRILRNTSPPRNVHQFTGRTA